MDNAYEIAQILMREMGTQRGAEYALRKSLMGNAQINRDYAEAASIIKTHVDAERPN